MIFKLLPQLALAAILLIAPTSLLANSPEEDGAEQVSATSTSTFWVWAEKRENQHAILLSRSEISEWEEIEQISDNDAINVVPAATVYKGQEIFIVWSAFKNGQSKLLYRYQEEGKWTDETVFHTGLSSNTAPTVAVDSKGKLWLVWVGFNGLNDEIYFSTWDGSEFSTPAPITNNAVPDILPVLGIDPETDLPWIQWQRFTTSGYVDYQAFIEDEEWTSPALVTATTETEEVEQTPAESMTEQRSALVKATAIQVTESTLQDNNVDEMEVSKPEATAVEIEIPEFVTEPDSASIYRPGYEIQSLPVRSMIRVQ